MSFPEMTKKPRAAYVPPPIKSPMASASEREQASKIFAPSDATSGTSISKPGQTQSSSGRFSPPAPHHEDRHRFIILDRFSRAGYDINGDDVPDVSHGMVVNSHVSSRIPHAIVENLDLGKDPSPLAKILFLKSTLEKDKHKSELWRLRGSVTNHIDAIHKLTERARNGEVITGVNMSVFPLKHESSVKEFEAWAGMPLTLENHVKIKAKLATLAQETTLEREQEGPKANLSDYEYQLGIHYELTQALEDLTRQRVPVYIAAGNNGPENFILHSLADDIITVGANDLEGRHDPSSAQNPYVDTYALGTYHAIPVYHEKRGALLGYDYTGDGGLDIPAKDVSNQGQFYPQDQEKSGSRYIELSGTSVASPVAMAEDWLKRQQKRFKASPESSRNR